MRNNGVYACLKRINDLNAMWNDHGVEDASEEPEFSEWEQLAMTLAEFIYGR